MSDTTEYTDVPLNPLVRIVELETALAAAQAQVREVEAIDAASLAGADACFQEKSREDNPHPEGSLRVAWWGGYDAAWDAGEVSLLNVRLMEVERERACNLCRGHPETHPAVICDSHYRHVLEERDTLHASSVAMREAIEDVLAHPSRDWPQHFAALRAALTPADVGKREEARQRIMAAAPEHSQCCPHLSQLLAALSSQERG